MQLTVVLPTLNEAGNVRELTRRIWDAVPGARVVVADDGSTDGTQDIVRELERAGRPVQLIARTGTPCLTDSIWEGLKAATTPYVAWMDADLSHPPELLPGLLAAAESTGCAIATRFAAGGRQSPSSMSAPDSVFAAVLSGTLNILVRRVLRLDVTDYTSGFIVCRRDLLAEHRLVGDYGEYFIELVYYLSRRGIFIVEVPYESPPRTWGESKTGRNLLVLSRRGVKYLWLTLRLRLPPSVFGPWSLAEKRARPS